MVTSLSRRDFVAGCLTAGCLTGGGIAAAAAPHALVASPYPAVGHSTLRMVLFDTRFPAAVVFSQAMVRRGVAPAPFHADVTAVWFQQLDPLWRRESIRVAGMTTASTLFCLEQLAWEHGLRVAFRGTHEPDGLGGVTHLLEAAASRRQDLMTGFSEERPWAAQVADHMASISEPIPAFPSRAEARAKFQSRTANSARDCDTGLISWLIAPKLDRHSLRSA